MFPKKYLPEDKLRQKICQSSPELRALTAKLEQVHFRNRNLCVFMSYSYICISPGLHKQGAGCPDRGEESPGNAGAGAEAAGGGATEGAEALPGGCREERDPGGADR